MPDLHKVTFEEMIRGSRDVVVSLAASTGEEDAIKEWAIQHHLEPDSMLEVMNQVATNCIRMILDMAEGTLNQSQVDLLGMQLQAMIFTGLIYGANAQKRVDHGE